MGAFDRGALRAIPNVGMRLGRQLSMMVFEYLFDNEGRKQAPTKASRWAWDTTLKFVGGYPKLVPQLLRYSILYERPAPAWVLKYLKGPEVPYDTTRIV